MTRGCHQYGLLHSYPLGDAPRSPGPAATSRAPPERPRHRFPASGRPRGETAPPGGRARGSSGHSLDGAAWQNVLEPKAHPEEEKTPFWFCGLFCFPPRDPSAKLERRAAERAVESPAGCFCLVRCPEQTPTGARPRLLPSRCGSGESLGKGPGRRRGATGPGSPSPSPATINNRNKPRASPFPFPTLPQSKDEANGACG